MNDSTLDYVKVGTAVSAPVLTFMGVSVQDWTYILSGIVSVLFIIEKSPVFITRVKSFIKWVRNKYARKE